MRVEYLDFSGGELAVSHYGLRLVGEPVTPEYDNGTFVLPITTYSCKPGYLARGGGCVPYPVTVAPVPPLPPIVTDPAIAASNPSPAAAVDPAVIQTNIAGGLFFLGLFLAIAFSG